MVTGVGTTVIQGRTAHNIDSSSGGIDIMARSTRYYKLLAARRVSGGQAKTLAMVPLWPGETLAKVRLDGIAFSTLGTNDRLASVDWGAWLIPVSDFTAHITVNASQSGSVNSLISEDSITDVAALDQYAENTFLNSTGFTHTNTDKWIQDLRGGSPYSHADEFLTGDVPGTLERIFRRENFMEPAFNFQMVGDKFNTTIDKNYYIRQPTFLIIAMNQPTILAETNFNWEFLDNAIGASDNFSLGQRIWDPDAVSAVLNNYVPDADGTEVNTSDAAVRALIGQFNGDNYIEADTIVNQDSMMAAIKGTLTIRTPIKSWTIGT